MLSALLYCRMCDTMCIDYIKYSGGGGVNVVPLRGGNYQDWENERGF